MPAELNSEVIPIDNPTVQNADTCSNIILVSPRCPSVIVNKNIPNKTPPKVKRNTLSARFNISTGIVCLNSSTRFRPLIVDIALTNTNVNVDVLIPPAVEPDAPPINIRNNNINRVGRANSPISIILNPAVLPMVT